MALPALALLATAASADTGHDLLFPKREATSLTARAAGQPFWALLAECAGVYGAASNWESGRGNTDAADQDAHIGERMANAAIERLMHDRGLSHDDALAYVGVEVNTGRAQGREILSGGDRDTWNYKRSACLDIEDVYHRYRNR
jgi:hypothetical protein